MLNYYLKILNTLEKYSIQHGIFEIISIPKEEYFFLDLEKLESYLVHCLMLLMN